MANPAPNLPLGTVIQNRYEVLEVLGSGGFATVYKARQLSIERPVAVKVLDHLRSDAEKVDRFKREALIAARLDHPNIVTIYDVGVHHETQPFIVMELLSGVTLRDELRDFGGIAPTRALPLFVDCLDGLAEAHKSNIVHKDLKPSNLFLHYPRQRRECLRIVDFGVARVLTNDTAHVTLTGNIFGTPRYFSPEYIQRQLVTPALDVYQMALILVEMLTGRPVVDVDNPLECIRIHGSGEIAVPEPVIDSPLGEVVVKALSIDHEARYPSAQEFCAALSRIDPESVAGINVEGPSRLLSELSGGLSPVSLATPPTSGKFAASTGMHVTPPPRPAVPARNADKQLPPVAEKVTTILPVTRDEDLDDEIDIELEDLEEFIAEDDENKRRATNDESAEEKTTEAVMPSYGSSKEESTSILGAEVIAELTEIDTGQQAAFERPLEDVILPPPVEDDDNRRTRRAPAQADPRRSVALLRGHRVHRHRRRRHRQHWRRRGGHRDRHYQRGQLG